MQQGYHKETDTFCSFLPLFRHLFPPFKAEKKQVIRLAFFLSNPKDWYVINGLCPLYVICAPHSMTSRVSVYFPRLRIDSIQPSRAEDIHGVAVITCITS